MQLQKDSIVRMVEYNLEVLFNDSETFEQITISKTQLGRIFRSILSNLDVKDSNPPHLDQPKIDLKEVELCVLYIAKRKGKLYTEPAEVWAIKLRKAIGYTIQDLEGQDQP